MSDFYAHIEVIDGITVCTCHGMLNVDGLVRISVSGWYGLTKQVIWDLRGNDLDEMDRKEYERLSRGFAARQDKRKTTACVIVLKDKPDLLEFRFYTLIGTHKVGQTVQQYLTTDIDEAFAWLASVEGQDYWDAEEHNMPMEIKN